MTKQRMAMRSNFPWSDFKKLGTPELSSSSSTSTALSPKNFEKRAHPSNSTHILSAIGSHGYIDSYLVSKYELKQGAPNGEVTPPGGNPLKFQKGCYNIISPSN